MRLKPGAGTLIAFLTLTACGSSGTGTVSSSPTRPGSPAPTHASTAPTATSPTTGASATATATTSGEPTTGTSISNSPTSASPSSHQLRSSSYVPVTLRTTNTHRKVGGAGAPTLSVTNQAVINVDGVPAATAAAIQTQDRQLADAALAASRSELKGQPPAPDGTDTPGNELSNSVVLVESDDNYVSVAFSSYTYTGGAHGGTVTTIETFRRATGAVVPISGLVADGRSKAFYNVVQRQARALLPAAVGDSGFDLNDGTTVAALQKTAAFPRTDGLEVVFGEYQVASYAQGQIFVVIPWSAFSGILAGGVIPISPAPASAIRAGTFAGGSDPAFLAAVAKRKITSGGYVVSPASYSESGDSQYELAQVIPTQDPTRDITVVARLGFAGNTERVTIVAAGHAKAGCTGVPQAVLVSTALACG